VLKNMECKVVVTVVVVIMMISFFCGLSVLFKLYLKLL
jgi:hypothetical protein